MVYEPQEDSEMLLDYIPDYAYGHVLDMGTGSGLLAFEAAKHANYVLAVDIDSEAVANVKEEVIKRKLKNVAVRESNLFSNISSDKKFNLIIFNPPYLPKEEGDSYDKALYGGLQGWEIIDAFLIEAFKHLESEGVILMLFSSHTNEDRVKILMSINYDFEKIAEKSYFFERLFIYKLTAKSR